MARRTQPPMRGETPSQPQLVSVEFLLPSGAIEQMRCSLDSSIMEIKARLFERVRGHSDFSQLKNKCFYNFAGTTSNGEKEFDSELQTLQDLDLCTYLLKLQERQGSQGEKLGLLNAEIANLIGRPLHDFDVMGPEVQDFRCNLLNTCREAVKQRNTSKLHLMHYAYPCSVHNTSADAATPSTRPAFSVNVFLDNGTLRELGQVKVGPETLPRDVIKMALESKFLKPIVRGAVRAEEMVLKVSGREEYLVDEIPLQMYSYIATCLTKDVQPTLVLKPFDEVVPDDEEEGPICPMYATGNPHNTQDSPCAGSTCPLLRVTASTEHPFTSLWDLPKCTYCIKLISVKNIQNLPGNHKVHVCVALYHGTESLCRFVRTKSGGKTPDNAVTVWKWNEVLEFDDLPVCDLPRGAKLCFVVTKATDTKGRGMKDRVPIAWVNMNVFDSACKLETGRRTLHAWPVPVDEQLKDVVNYMGTTDMNPSGATTTTTSGPPHGVVELEVECFPNLPPGLMLSSKPISYPSMDQIRQYASDLKLTAADDDKFPASLLEHLERTLDQDPLAELYEEDKELIWKLRDVCLHRHPSSLPKLLQSVSWESRGEVAQLYCLLERWQEFSYETAMELLNYRYADVAVRSLAVDRLRTMTDDQLNLYLLQLVQALKFEPYMDNSLVHFLLQRGLANRRIGHFLFWYLRSEMHRPSVVTRFGLLLEAYCRGCGSFQLKTLTRQVTALSKLKHLSDELQKKKDKECAAFLFDSMNDPQFKSSMEDFVSPVDPTLHCRGIRVDKCKVIYGKKRSIWLVFSNRDDTAIDALMIFEKRESIYYDMRQDMLTFQLINAIDFLWKSAGLDLRMKPYLFLAVGEDVGMTDAVYHSSLIANIQKNMAGLGVGHKMLYLWLKEQNPLQTELDKAVENFSLSCAGSCVATYVLGIGDRNPKNTLLGKNGRLVQSDIHHFLGNFRRKVFELKREKAFILLPEDFIYIITKGGDKNSPLFSEFQKTCEEAFLKLREKASLIISLFNMMAYAGIPELRGTEDIGYIRDFAFCLHGSQDIALEVFRKNIQLAIQNSWLSA